jgi:hypothetical protein
MSVPKKLKKSETLEIRIPYPTKEAFMARCRDEGRSASEALRVFIDQHLEAAAPRRRALLPQTPAGRRRFRFAVAGAIAAMAGAAALPSLARPSAQTEFQRLDLNGDGRVSYAELSRNAQVSADIAIGPSRLTARGERLTFTAAAGPEAAARDALLKLEFSRLDANGDGAVSLGEYQRHGGAPVVAP